MNNFNLIFLIDMGFCCLVRRRVSNVSASYIYDDGDDDFPPKKVGFCLQAKATCGVPGVLAFVIQH